jgi:hypothetical protein
MMKELLFVYVSDWFSIFCFENVECVGLNI